MKKTPFGILPIKTLILLILIVISSKQSFSGRLAISTIDSTALVELYDATDGDNWTNTLNSDKRWKIGPVENWKGIYVGGGFVTSIDLHGNNLKGKIPPEIGNLSRLSQLNLSNNNLTCPLPLELKKLTNLTILKLSSNDFSEPDLSWVEGLVSLRELSLDYNPLGIPIPDEIYLSSLEFLKLDNCNLTGSISPGIQNLDNIQTLDIEENSLKEIIPPEIGTLESIITLNISKNQLTGGIPVEIGNLSKLETLKLSKNKLTGQIPDAICYLSGLKYLHLDENQFFGNIPTDIGQLTRLKKLILKSNSLDGPIPSEIGNNTSLTDLQLDHNLLSGTIPSDIGNLTSLQTLWLHHNKLDGNIPGEISQLKNLSGLNLSLNLLSGSIPPEIGNLINVTYLDLRANKLSGEVPNSIGKLIYLRDLKLDDNQFIGAIPEEIGNLQSLLTVNIRNNRFDELPHFFNVENEFICDSNLFSFEDFERNLALVNKNTENPGFFNYSPQLLLGSEYDTTAIIGKPYTLSFNFEGDNNLYTWFKNGGALGNTVLSSLTTPSALPTDSGSYYVTVTNSVVPGLTLQSYPIHLKLILDVPTLISPADDAINQPIILPFKWNGVLGTDFYALQICSSPDFKKTEIIYGGDTTATTYVANQLENDAEYYWRVRAINATDTSDWSSVWSFRTVIKKPMVPKLESPANNSAKVDTSLVLSWFSSFGAENYALQVSTSSEFSDSVVFIKGIDTTNYLVTALGNDSTYYWRVNATNIGGTSDWSEVWDFRTIPEMPAIPILESPDSASVNQEISLLLSWFKAARADSYSLQVSPFSNFNKLVVNQSEINSTNFSVSGLENSTEYFWRVNASKNAAKGVVMTSDWSTVWNFTTLPEVPDAPFLEYPDIGLVDLDTALVMSWSNTERADSYRLQVSADPQFNSTVIDLDTLTSTFFPVSELEHETTYYWRVNAANVAGSGEWSDVWNFTTIIEKPEVPVLLSPADSSINQPITLPFSWMDTERAENYTFQVSTTPDFSNVFWGEVTANTDIIANGLRNNTKYYWRVNAINIADSSDWSEVWSFTTIIAMPDDVFLKSPADKSIDLDTSLVLSWHPSERAESYTLQVFSSPDESSILFDSTGLTATSFSISGLDRNATYYWRVNAANIADTTDWSDVWSFTTVPPVPEAPVLASPDSGLVELDTSLELSWINTEFAESYTLQVSTTPDFSNPVFDQPGIPSTSYSITNLETITTYYWRVNATNISGTSDWSTVWKFTTYQPIPEDLIPVNLVIIDGLHSPIFMIEGIEFLPENDLVVFTKWGKKVFEKKSYNNDLDFSEYPAGTYYYVLNVKFPGKQKQFKSFVDVVKN